MPKLTQRLVRLERTVGRVAGAVVCPMCRGYPHAAIHVMCESDPNGPGMRATGERYLVSGHEERIGPDLRCLRCGEDAEQVHLISLHSLNPASRGPRVLDPAADDAGDGGEA